MLPLIEANKQRMESNLQFYRRRQAIVKHPFGVIKRQWDFYHIITSKTIKNASADGLIFNAYNLRRIFNLVDQNELKKYLRAPDYFFLLIYAYFRAKSDREKYSGEITVVQIGIR